MPNELVISDTLSLPVDAATEAMAIVGRRGMGKSHTARVIAEAMIGASIPITVIDTVGVWWGLRSAADGEKPGLPIVIFGGDHGDVPLDVTSGVAVAQALVETGQSAVLDVSAFDARDMRTFCAEFLRELYRINRSPRHVFADEADELAPQRAVPGGLELAQAMNHVLRRGRVRGLGATLVSQRPALINKDVLSQAGTLIIHGLTGLQDVKTMVDWISMRSEEGQAAEVKRSLPGLKTGTAWVWSPEWLGVLDKVQIRRAWTFDSSATPKVGEFVRAPKTLAPIDLAALGKRIAEAVERHAQDDPAVLRAEITALTHELQMARTITPAPAAPAEPVVELVEVATFTDADRQTLADAEDTAVRLVASAAESLETLETIRELIADVAARAAASQTTRTVLPSVPQTPAIPKRTPVVQPEAPAVSRVTESSDSVVAGRAENAILAAVIMHGELDNQQLSIISGYSAKSSSFKNALGRLRSSGYIRSAGGVNRATEDGRKARGYVAPLPQGQELVAHWMKNIKGKAERTILSSLISVWPDGPDNEELAQLSGYSVTSSSFKNALGKLRSLQLIHGDRHGNVADSVLAKASREPANSHLRH